MKRYFIAGTDTNCGKTYVTGQLVDYFKMHSKSVIALKPVVSGCEEVDGVLVNEDVMHLQRHNVAPKLDICRWRFKPAISPHLAAAQVGQSVLTKEILAFCEEEQFKPYEYLLVEGAGGLMSPINQEETWLDFLALSQMPVILVVGMRLGCLNHALLTEMAFANHHIHCIGWVANCLDPDMLELSANIDTLVHKMKLPRLATIAYGSTIDDNRLSLI